MKVIKGLFVSMILSGLMGCMMHTVQLMNDRGETVECKGKADEVDACAKKYEEAGYKRVEAPPMSHAPMGGSGY